MTDKEKLKDDLNDIVDSAISSFWMKEYHDEHERRKLEWRGVQDTINSLIDRQPTEEEAEGIKNTINYIEFGSSPTPNSMRLFVKRDFARIRKALGGEEVR